MRRRTEQLLAWLCLLLLGCGTVWSGAVAAGDFTVSSATGRLESERFLVDASIDVRLNANALEALENGVALEFELDGQLLRPRRLWWDARVAAATRRFQLMRHTLAGGYTLSESGRTQHLTFKNVDDALAALGEVRDFLIGDAGDAPETAQLRARLRLRLNIEALPAPLRPIAYISPGWHLSSGWHEWRLAR